MATDDAPPTPAPLGWCSEDLANGTYVPAVTTLMGTALCAYHHNDRVEAATRALANPELYY